MRVRGVMAGMTLVLALLGQATRAAAQALDEDRDLVRLSARAESSLQHTQVADLLRDRARRLDAEARRLERTARRLEQQRFPHQHKLPAIQQPGHAERQRARAARARAQQHRRLAAEHLRTAEAATAEP